MGGFINDVQVTGGVRINESVDPSQSWNVMQRSSGVGLINGTGDPEGVVSANPASMFFSRDTGAWYRKASGTGNVGWVIDEDLYFTPYIVDAAGGPGSSFTTIQSAIDQVNTDYSGSTGTQYIPIVVRPGDYNEVLSIVPGVRINLYGAPRVGIATTDSGLTISDDQVFTAGGFAIFQNVTFTGTVTLPILADYQFNNCQFQGAVTNNSSYSAYNCYFGATLTVTNGYSTNLYDCSVTANVDCQGTLLAENTFFFSGITLSSSTNILLRNCPTVGTISGTNAGATNNVINCNNVEITATAPFRVTGISGTSNNQIFDSSPTITLPNTLVGNIYKATRSAVSYVVLPTDLYIGITDTAAPRTVTLMTAAQGAHLNQLFIVKDESGAAATNNITVTVDGVQTIDGATSQVISSNYGSLTMMFDGTNYFIL